MLHLPRYYLIYVFYYLFLLYFCFTSFLLFLEKLDPLSGLLTILCNHSFHCVCLSQWREENRCPICRYTQTPFVCFSMLYLIKIVLTCRVRKVYAWVARWRRIYGSVSFVATLAVLDTRTNMLRYDFRYFRISPYLKEHFFSTKHTYALELESQRVWDYTKESYLHRLISSHLGKVVEVAPPLNIVEETSNTVKQTDLMMV